MGLIPWIMLCVRCLPRGRELLSKANILPMASPSDESVPGLSHGQTCVC